MRRRLGGVYYGWIVVAVSFLAYMLVSGSRMSFGPSFKPMLADFETNRGMLSLAMSLNQVFYGLAGPVVGWLSDRWGAKSVIFASALLAALGMVGSSLAPNLWMLYLAYGVFLAIGFSGATTIPVSALITRWFRRRSGLALGIATAGTPAGHLLMVPMGMYFILLLGWRSTYALLGGLIALLVLPTTWWLLKGDPSEVGGLPDGEAGWSKELGQAAATSLRGEGAEERPDQGLGQALRSKPYWLLSTGWFTCGFTGFMIAAHLVPFATDAGFGEMQAATALALMGGISVFGTLGVGGISDRLGRKNPLAAMYFLRFLSFPLIMTTLVASHHFLVYLFAVIMGFTLLATVPLTSALVREIYGQQSMGIILGTILLVHQVGAAIGVYLGGAIFDATRSYYWAFMIGALLALVAAVGSFLIREDRPVEYGEALAASA
jgi:MFS family permease